MIPVLGPKYELDIEIISKPQAEYMADDYFDLDLPVAPAVMVGEHIVVEGADVDQHELEAAICQQLGLPPPAAERKGFLKKLFRG